MLHASSDILYVRAALKPLARQIEAAGGVVRLLREHSTFRELFVPHFYGARPFWRRPAHAWPPATTSGALGRQIACEPGAVISAHPSHAFVGFGERVVSVLADHDRRSSCFHPVSELADRHDFSMLLIGCVDDSPGFSTVHAAQFSLGLSQKHIVRFLQRWDEARDGRRVSSTAAELPGCSRSFSKFYSYYEADDNLVRGDCGGVSYVWVPSARRALNTELRLLRESARFVECGRLTCLTCRLRWY